MWIYIMWFKIIHINNINGAYYTLEFLNIVMKNMLFY